MVVVELPPCEFVLLPPASSDQRFTDAALAASDDCIKIIGLDGALLFMSEGGRRVMEVDDFEAIRGCPWPDFWEGQGNEEAKTAIAKARSGKAARFTGYASTAKGRRRYWDVKVSPLFADDGSIDGILSVSRDITELKLFEEEQALLRGELSHRIRNIVSLVQAIVGQSLRDGEDVATARPALLGRINALGRTQDLLTQRENIRTTLRGVAETAAGEHPEGRIAVSGPEVALSSRSGLAIALALHELATNAIKYGALSTATGRVDLSWRITSADGEDRLDLTWVETGGPPVTAPTRKGFGSRMIERALTSYVRGKAEVSYAPTGVSFRLSAPLDALATS